MKTKKQIFEKLGHILTFYENHRICLNLSEEQAKQKTLDAYKDFDEWLKEDE